MATRIVKRWDEVDGSSDEAAVEEIINVYLKITTGIKEDGDSYDIMEIAENFKRVVLLMNSSGVIDSPGTE